MGSKQKNKGPRRAKYAHPLDVPQSGALYVPAGVGAPKLGTKEAGNRRDNPNYVPGGLSIRGQFYQGGEAIDLGSELMEHLDVLSHEQATQLLGMLHGNREQAVTDWNSRRTSPRKGIPPRSVGTPPAPSAPIEALQGPRRKLYLPDEVRQHLTAEEDEGVQGSQVRTFVNVFNTSGPVEQLVAGAKLGEGKRGWYKDASKAVVGLFGSFAPSFAALLAATSPVKSVGQNLNNALATWAAYLEFRSRIDHEPSIGEVERWLQRDLKRELKGDGYSIGGEYPNILRALTSSAPGAEKKLSGPKVNSFRQNILGELQPVTNDTWAAAFMDVMQGEIAGKGTKDDYGNRSSYSGGYAALSAKTRMAAEALNRQLMPGEPEWTPAEVQETTWSVFRALSAAMGQARHSARKESVEGKGKKRRRTMSPEEQAARIPDAKAALNSLTHEYVNGNADFTSALIRAVSNPANPTEAAAGKSLIRLGFGRAIAALSRRTGRDKAASTPLAGRAVDALGPDEYPHGLAIARQAAMSQGRFDNAVTAYAKAPRRARYMAAPKKHPSFDYDHPVSIMGTTRPLHEWLDALGDLQAAGEHEQAKWMSSMLGHELQHGAAGVGVNQLHDTHQFLRAANAEGIAHEWRGYPGLTRSAQTGRLFEQGQRHADPMVRQLTQSAYQDPEEHPATFAALSDYYRDLGDDDSADLTHALRPYKDGPPTEDKRTLSRSPAKNKARYMAAPRSRPPFNYGLPLTLRLPGAPEAETLSLGEWIDRMADLQRTDPAAADALSASLGRELAHNGGYSMRPTAEQSRDARRFVRQREGGDIAPEWQGHAGYTRAAQHGRLHEQAQQHADPLVRQMSQDAYADPAEDPSTFAALSDYYRDLGDDRNADLTHAVRPYKQAKKGPRRVYASQTEKSFTFEDVYAKGQSSDTSLYKDYADQMAKQVGLQGKSYTGIGDSEDGSEQSVLTEIPQAADIDTLRYVGAWQGLTGNQRSVLVFAPDHSAKDSLYSIQVPETDAAKVRQALTQSGVPYRTIVPGKQGTRVVVYDQGRALRDNVAHFAQRYHAPVRETIGRGDYVGGGSRADARAKYRQIIADYEAGKGRRPDGRGAVPPRPAR